MNTNLVILNNFQLPLALYFILTNLDDESPCWFLQPSILRS